MARIPDAVVARLKGEVSLERLAAAAGIELKRHGADLLGLCPFHDDHEPSLVITPEKNLWHCLGACQAGGSVIDWVMKLEGVSFRHAVELLENDYLPSLAADGPRPKHTTVPKLTAPVSRTADDARRLVEVVDYYHETLKQSPEALAYLEQRGIGAAEAIETFKLGFANRTLGYRLPKANRKAGAALRGQLQRLGILRESGHEHFNGSIVFPVFDREGRVTERRSGHPASRDIGTSVCGIYGRKINDNLRQGTPKHLYLPGPHRGVWNADALAASDEVILCESIIDALTFWCAGYRHVTASYGIEGFTAGHLQAFQDHAIKRVLIAYDRDPAGDGAAETLSKKLMAEGFDCYRLQVPKGMDVNEYAIQVTPATKSLGVVLRSAQWLGQGDAPGRAHIAEGTMPEATQAQLQPVASDARAPIIEPVNAVREPEPEPEPEPAPVLPASPVPEPPRTVLPESEHTGNERVFALGDRRYRVRGLDKNGSFDVLKVNVLVSKGDGYDVQGSTNTAGAGCAGAVHVDTFDLYQSKPRASFIKQAALELGVTEAVIKADLGKVLLELEALQDEILRTALKPSAPALNDTETAAALALLKDPNLLARISADFTACGIVGESTNCLVGYLAAISRKLEHPLAVIIQSTSAAGKSSLMEAILRFVPATEKVQYSAMTGQSLFYMGETDLQHKVLAIAEEEGAAQAAYALKLLQSEGEVTIASTGKDETSGELVTKEYRVEGPVMLLMTTTAIDIDEELLNRCLVLSVNEDRAQTEAIHRLQRQKRTLEGLQVRAERDTRLAVHQHAQQLLKPLAVVNPYAEQLTFLSDQTRTRRDHEKYLTLIDTIALLHQYQRTVKTHAGVDYIEVTVDDIAVANALAHEVLGRTLDELPPQTRKLLGLIQTMVTEACASEGLVPRDYRFSRRAVRAYTRWGHTQLQVHLRRLEALEYVLVHRGGRGQSFVYELLHDGADTDGPRLSGLIEVQALRGYDAKKTGLKADLTGSKRPQDGDLPGPKRGAENPEKPSAENQLDAFIDVLPTTTVIKGNGKASSYGQLDG